MFKKACLALSVSLLLLTACSGGGGGGQTAAPIVASYKLPDTGQSTSYTDTFGEDSDYNINTPAYTYDSSKKTVLDNNTLLMWEQLPDAKDHVQKTHADASTHCEAQTTGGYNDWRLPSIDELESIVNFGSDSPAIDMGFFPNTKSSEYWTSLLHARNKSSAWYVGFVYGFSGRNDRTISKYVRCVRLSSSDEPTTRFTDNGDKTITDQKTKLMWQQLPDAADHTTDTWEDALRHCEGLSLAGHDNWRLPNKRELLSITDRKHISPAIDTSTFPNTKFGDYWSSSIDASDTSNALLVGFHTGDSTANGLTTRNYVRCVR